MNTDIAAIRQRLRTPRAAAVAGILFAVLFSAAMPPPAWWAEALIPLD
jgi:apolipoprotein N-acyltransferase